MISERLFSSHYSAFWRENLPNLEAVVRAINLGYERVGEPASIKTIPARRDLVSEAGYRLFFATKESVSPVPISLVEDCARQAFLYLQNKTSEFWNDEFFLSKEEYKEIENIVFWLRRYFSALGLPSEEVIRPHFAGHGILSSCDGDFLARSLLFEMKYVDRNFRGNDIKQVLTYSSLRYFESGNFYEKLFLVNPFKGIQFKATAQEIIESAAGISAVEFYKRVSYVLSSGEVSH